MFNENNQKDKNPLTYETSHHITSLQVKDIIYPSCKTEWSDLMMSWYCNMSDISEDADLSP